MDLWEQKRASTALRFTTLMMVAGQMKTTEGPEADAHVAMPWLLLCDCEVRMMRKDA